MIREDQGRTRRTTLSTPGTEDSAASASRWQAPAKIVVAMAAKDHQPPPASHLRGTGCARACSHETQEMHETHELITAHGPGLGPGSGGPPHNLASPLASPPL